MAEVWEAGSTVKLCYVPWDSSYNNVVAFPTVEDQTKYFNTCPACPNPLVMGAATYVRPNMPLTVDGPYSLVHSYNYCVVDNPVQPVENSQPERLFYFIANCEYASPSSCRITLQLDVWQTRVIHDGAQFGNAYLERGHAAVSQIAKKVWDEGWQRSKALSRYAQVPEGIDVGAEYRTAPFAMDNLQSQSSVIILSTIDLTSTPGSVSNPNLVTAKGSVVDGLPSGADAYFIPDAAGFTNVMGYLSIYSWIAQGIIGIYFVPRRCVTDTSDPRTIGDTTVYRKFSFADWQFSCPNPLMQDYRQQLDLPDQVNTYDKLLTYPYSAIELTAFSGQSVLYKPQLYHNDQTLYFNIRAAVLPPFIRIGAYLTSYNAGGGFPVSTQYEGFDGNTKTVDIGSGDFLDGALWLSDFPQFSTVNNNYTTYLASTVNTRGYNYESAGWSLAASNASAQNAYEQAQRSIATQSANQQIQNQLIDQQQFLSALGGGIGTVGSLLSGNIGGAVMGAANTAMQYVGAEASQRAGNAQFANNQALASANADANQRLAEYVSAGNYQNAIAGINAAVQDAALTPPSQVGQSGGNGFNAKYGLFSFVVRVKTLTDDAMKTVLSYFMRYGYAVHEYVKVDRNHLCLMNEVTFWKAHDVPVTCATATDTEVQVIKGIFSQGVSVYSDPDVIGHETLTGNLVKERFDSYLLE